MSEYDRLKAVASTIKDAEAKSILENLNVWESYFNEVAKARPDMPRVYAITTALELIVICGLSDRGEESRGAKERYLKFFSTLTTKEKTFLILAMELKPTDEQVEELFQEYLRNPNDQTHSALMKRGEMRDEFFERQITSVFAAYFQNKTNEIEHVFVDRLKLLYGVRSDIVHSGEPDVIGAMLMDGVVRLHYGERKKVFFTIKYPFKNLFLRALCRNYSIDPGPVISAETESFLFNEHLRRHANDVCKYVYEDSSSGPTNKPKEVH